MRTFHLIVVVVSLATIALSLSGCCCPPVTAAREAARRATSANNMHQLGIAMKNYQVHNGAWPKTLDDVEEYLEYQLPEITTNPVTGDFPGYEYVPPVNSPDSAGAVVLYQLRDGQRDLSLDVLYGDGHVGPAPGAP